MIVVGDYFRIYILRGSYHKRLRTHFIFLQIKDDQTGLVHNDTTNLPFKQYISLHYFLSVSIIVLPKSLERDCTVQS